MSNISFTSACKEVIVDTCNKIKSISFEGFKDGLKFYTFLYLCIQTFMLVVSFLVLSLMAIFQLDVVIAKNSGVSLILLIVSLFLVKVLRKMGWG